MNIKINNFLAYIHESDVIQVNLMIYTKFIFANLMQFYELYRINYWGKHTVHYNPCHLFADYLCTSFCFVMFHSKLYKILAKY